MATIALTPKSGGGLCVPEDTLKPADIIVSTTAQLVSRFIRTATASSISHAGLYIGNGKIIEALGSGVMKNDLAAALAGDTLAVAYRHVQMTPAAAKAIVSYAISKIGLGYDYGGLAGANPIVCMHVLGPVNCMIASKFANSPNRFYCSELVLQAFKNAGLPLVAGFAARTDPQAIVNAYTQHKLAYVGHLKA